MKDLKHLKSFDKVTENLNISDVSDSHYSSKITNQPIYDLYNQYIIISLLLVLRYKTQEILILNITVGYIRSTLTTNFKI